MPNKTVSNTPSILKPICKLVWLGADCQIQDCPRAHPLHCTYLDFLVPDQEEVWVILMISGKSSPHGPSQDQTLMAVIQSKLYGLN